MLRRSEGAVLLGRAGVAALALLVCAPVLAAPVLPPPPLKLWHKDDIVETVRLTRAQFLLDGKLLAEKTEPPEGADGKWFETVVDPGPHVLSVELVYIVQGSFFDYINGYRFIATGQLHFDAPRGYVVEVTTSSASQLDLTLPWADRFQFKLQAMPREVVTKIVTDVRVASPNQKIEDVAPIAVTSDVAEEKRLQALEEAAIQEVLQAAAEAPPSPPEGDAKPLSPEPPSEPAAAPAPQCEAGTVHFDHNAWQVSEPCARALLGYLRKLGGEVVQLRVHGHADHTGTPDYNERLSLQRAQAVAKVLRAALSESRIRVSVQAFGQRVPVCTEDTEPCRAKNRRVELRAVARSAAQTAVRNPTP